VYITRDAVGEGSEIGDFGRNAMGVGRGFHAKTQSREDAKEEERRKN
jgi:hypothetical protein